MGVGSAVAATLLRGLGWILFVIGALLIGLTFIRALGLQAIAPMWSDALGGAAFAIAGAASRLLARKFETLG